VSALLLGACAGKQAVAALKAELARPILLLKLSHRKAADNRCLKQFLLLLAALLPHGHHHRWHLLLLLLLLLHGVGPCSLHKPNVHGRDKHAAACHSVCADAWRVQVHAHAWRMRLECCCCCSLCGAVRLRQRAAGSKQKQPEGIP
jgi:hypothetical protein